MTMENKHPASPTLTIFYIVEPPEYEILACYLLASIRSQFPKDVKVIGYCPEHRLHELHPAVIEAHERMNAEIRTFSTEGRFSSAYPHGNKILASFEKRETEYSMFVDSDVLFLRPNTAEALTAPNQVSCSPAASMVWAGQEIWTTIYDALGMKIPGERINLMRRGKNVIPYFSSGLVTFPENDTTGAGRFPEVWLKTAREIDEIEGLDRKRPYLDQMSLPLAIQKSNLDWNMLPEAQHFILGGNIRGNPLPTDREIYTIHYRRWKIVKEVGLEQVARKMLKNQVGVRFVRRLVE